MQLGSAKVEFSGWVNAFDGAASHSISNQTTQRLETKVECVYLENDYRKDFSFLSLALFWNITRGEFIPILWSVFYVRVSVCSNIFLSMAFNFHTLLIHFSSEETFSNFKFSVKTLFPLSSLIAFSSHARFWINSWEKNGQRTRLMFRCI